jgi:hypothetical protein
MSFDIEVKHNLQELERRSRQSIVSAVREIASLCLSRIRTNSPKRSGALSRSWVMEKVSELTYKISTSIKYAKWVNDGTGIYGSGKPITPKRAKYLRFQIAGSIIFAKSVRGQKGQHYVEETVLQTENRVSSIVTKWMKRVG